MADVSTSTKQAQIVFELANSANATEPDATRTLSFDLADGTEAAAFKTRAEDFKATYLAQFANAATSNASVAGYGNRNSAVGSLIQATNWRDIDSSNPPLVCIGMKITFVDTTKVVYDI